MLFSPHRWLRISLFNLLIVSVIGVILRYKILYPLPFVDQKHLLHGHSHFAFAGWISQALMALLVEYLARQKLQVSYKKYDRLLLLNLLSAYGMLIAFPIEGYGLYSISFSTASIFVSYVFAFIYWKDLNKLKGNQLSHTWFKGALVFNAISSAGAFSLATMMVTKTINQNWYLAAIYFFLHFQYNGWFFFSCMGLLYNKLQPYIPDTGKLKLICRLFLLACIPAYFLSALWLDFPFIIYLLVIIAALAQVIAWGMLVRLIYQNRDSIKTTIPKSASWVLGLSALALSIKLLLQAGSVIPALSNLAFGFRSIVIGYLHLVLLAVITLFILGYMFSLKQLQITKTALAALWIFTAGIFFNELLLMIQGVSAMYYVNIPHMNELLLVAALVLFTGLLVLNVSQLKKADKNYSS